MTGSQTKQQRPQQRRMPKFTAGPAAATHSMSRLGMTQVPEVHGRRLCPPEQEATTRESAECPAAPSTVEIGSMCFSGVQRHAAQLIHAVRIAELPGDIAMRRFVQRDRENHRNRSERDGLDQRKIH